MTKIAILGCTGSIGRQTLDIVRSNRDKFDVVGLSCANNVDELCALTDEFCCNSIGVYNAAKYSELKNNTKSNNVYCGDDALTEVMADADTVVIAVTGMIGLKAVMFAIDSGKTVALANKESLVAGGELVMSALKKSHSKLYPIDSEHSAVWQCLQGEKKFKRLILTASGGPFFFTPKNEFGSITPERAVAHPNWRMGKKISVDCATMMNKGLEIIEARWLFDTVDIDYVIHPESVVHSMVEFYDGSIKAQASFPDMRLPIQYALLYPEHAVRDYKPLSMPLSLRFLMPDEDKFPAPKLAKQALKEGGTAPIVLNAANEAAVALFLNGKIAFTEITEIVEHALERENTERVDCVDNVFKTHNRVYETIYSKHIGD